MGRSNKETARVRSGSVMEKHSRSCLYKNALLVIRKSVILLILPSWYFLVILILNRAFSSVVERCIHIAKIAGSIPATPTNRSPHPCGEVFCFMSTMFGIEPRSGVGRTRWWFPVSGIAPIGAFRNRGFLRSEATFDSPATPTSRNTHLYTGRFLY